MGVKAYFKEAQAHFHNSSEHIIISSNEEKDFDHKVFVIIENEEDGKEIINLQINCEFHCAMFRGVTVWKQFVVIGFDTQCYLFNIDTKKTVSHKLNSYFDSFFVDTANVFICSTSHVNCFNANGEFLWRSDKLGADNVKIYRVTEGIIYGTGDWGGKIRWKDFELNSFEMNKPKNTKNRFFRFFRS